MKKLAMVDGGGLIAALAVFVIAGSGAALAQNPSSPAATPSNTPARAPSAPAAAPAAPVVTPSQSPVVSPNARPGGLPRQNVAPQIISGPNLYITPTAPALVGPGYNRPPMRYYNGDEVIRRNPNRQPQRGPVQGDYIGPRLGRTLGDGESVVALPYDNRSGVSIRGDFATDNFRLGVSLNSGSTFYRRHWADGYIGEGFRRGCGGYSLGGYSAWNNRYYNNNYPVYGNYVGAYVIEDAKLLPTPTPAPAASVPGAPAQIVPAPTGPTGQPIVLAAFDRAVLSIRDGEFDTSANALREHLRAFPRDVVAIRLLSLALMGQRQNAEGVALIVMAYQLDPTLAYRPVSVEFDNADDPRGPLARVSEGAVAFAQKQGTSSSWLAAIVTLQGRDLKAPALRLLKRAEENGLEARVADELRKALK